MESREKRLAVAIITRNEQGVLEETIRSAAKVADEIHILDTGSTDRTRELASLAGAVVHRHAWTDSFSDARNALLDKILSETSEPKPDCILWLDAGERLHPEAIDELRIFVKDQVQPETVYLMAVEQPAANDGEPIEQIVQPRLLPADARLRYEGRVAESLQGSIQRLGIHVDTSPGRIVCHPRCHAPERRRAVAQRNLDLIAKDQNSVGELSVRLQLTMADAYLDLDQTEMAADIYLQAIRSSKPGSLELLMGYYGLLNVLDRQPTDLDRQIAIALEAIEVFPLDAQLLCVMGSCMQRKQRYDLATRAFQMALHHGEIVIEAWHSPQIGETSAVCLAMMQRLQGDLDAAADTLLTAVDMFQRSTKILRHLLDVQLHRGDKKAALAAAEDLYGTHADLEVIKLAVRGACGVQKDQGHKQAVTLLKAAYDAGCREPFCLRWFALGLLKTDRTEELPTVLEQWEQIEPENIEMAAFRKAMEQTDRIDEIIASLQPEHAQAAQPVTVDMSSQSLTTQRQTVDEQHGEVAYSPHDMPSFSADTFTAQPDTVTYRLDPAEETGLTITPNITLPAKGKKKAGKKRKQQQ